MKQCNKCANGKQLGQNAKCPIHNESTFAYTITFEYDGTAGFSDDGVLPCAIRDCEEVVLEMADPFCPTHEKGIFKFVHVLEEKNGVMHVD